MSSGEPSPPAQASISTTSFDVLDNARLINAAPITSQPSKPSGDNTDTEAIEEAVPIVQTTLPVPESKPEIEKNGLDVNTKKSPDEPDVSCLINCLYYTQQCCDCTIVWDRSRSLVKWMSRKGASRDSPIRFLGSRGALLSGAKFKIWLCNKYRALWGYFVIYQRSIGENPRGVTCRKFYK